LNIKYGIIHHGAELFSKRISLSSHPLIFSSAEST
jgi:hypothetical protein